MADSVRSQWEANAQLYAELIADHGTPHHKLILNPCVEELLGDVKGKKMIDAGCGEGYLTRYYASKGAEVVGIDLSSNLIEIARDKSPEDLLVDYQVGDICKMEFVADGWYDVLLCNLVILNIPCYQEAFSEFNRVLKSGGVLVFSIVHPAFNFYGPGAWEMGPKDPETKRRRGLFFKVDHYMHEMPYERYWRSRDGEKFPEPITFYHRTISTYVRELVNAGFRIEAMEEPMPMKKDEFFERERRIPFFLVFKAIKM